MKRTISKKNAPYSWLFQFWIAHWIYAASSPLSEMDTYWTWLSEVGLGIAQNEYFLRLLAHKWSLLSARKNFKAVNWEMLWEVTKCACYSRKNQLLSTWIANLKALRCFLFIAPWTGVEFCSISANLQPESLTFLTWSNFCPLQHFFFQNKFPGSGPPRPLDPPFF